MNEKTAVPVPSVSADGEQSLSYVTEEIVTQEPDYFNFDDGKHGDEYLKQMLRMSEPSYLPTMTINQIYETVYESRRPIIENLLYPGAYLFVGAPKVGKSFFMAQLAYHVSVGLPLWDYKTHPGTVLYLALEDDYRRIQERLYRMFGVDGTDNLYFATFAKSLATGLFEQLKRFVKEHPETNLIIIDTLQKIREVNNDRYSYTEFSSSGNEVHIIFKADKFKYDTSLYYIMNHKSGIEVYVDGATSKYVTVTGKKCENYEFGDRTEKLKILLKKYMRRPETVARNAINAINSEISGTDIIEIAKNSKNGAAFKSLWEGSITGYLSHSEADMALCSYLAFWTGKDAYKMDYLFSK